MHALWSLYTHLLWPEKRARTMANYSCNACMHSCRNTCTYSGHGSYNASREENLTWGAKLMKNTCVLSIQWFNNQCSSFNRSISRRQKQIRQKVDRAKIDRSTNLVANQLFVKWTNNRFVFSACGVVGGPQNALGWRASPLRCGRSGCRRTWTLQDMMHNIWP